MMNDEQLLEKAQQLDPAALRTLHQRFYEPVARYVSFKVGDSQTVEDLSGDVFVRALEGLRRGHGWRDSPRGWIMGIARNVVADHYRQRERISQVKLEENLVATDAANNPSHHLMLNERNRHLVRAMERLTDDQRDVILMRFLEGIDIKSVAKAINKTPGAVKGLQYRALKALAEILKDSWAEDIISTEP